MLDKDKIGDLLEDMADLLEISGENPFKLRAYRTGAERLRELTSSKFLELIEKDELTSLAGIGAALSDKIKQAHSQGKIDKFEETKKTFPESLLELRKIHGVGPKSIRKLYDQLGIESLDGLEKALMSSRLSEIEGFGPKTVENIKKSLDRLDRFEGRVLIMKAVPVVEKMLSYLTKNASPERMDVAGSYRRGAETIGDIDILVTETEPGRTSKTLLDHPDVEDVLASGETKTSVLMNDGLQVDLRVVGPEEYGAALLYFTGSKEHNVKLRGLARKKGWTINEYGLFDQETDQKLAGETEKSIYEKLGLDWIAPELREDHGEVEAAGRRELPQLIEREQIRGDCHMHTESSDGKNSLEEMVDQARDLGYDYIVITDHSRSLKVASGLSEKKLLKQIEKIRKLNEKYDEIEVFAGTESDILGDGSLDYSDEVLAKLDLVIAAVHSKFNLEKEEQTERIVKALKHPATDVLAHPTGRMLGRRDPYAVDAEAVLKTAKEQNVAIEINSNGHRLDANDSWCRMGKEIGVKFVISTDSHSIDHMWMMALGINTARRGWLTREDILNTGKPWFL